MDASHHIWHLGWLYSNRSLFNSMTRQLSPTAQAVMDAMHRSYDHEPTRRAIAAEILRTAVDLVVPDKCPPIEDFNEFDQGYAVAHIAHRADFLAIITELESANG